MIKRSLIPLLLLLGSIIWIPCLKAQDCDTICLTTKQVDYFILQDLDAKFLRKDTTFKGNKIKDLNRVISRQTDIIDNNDLVVSLKDTIINRQGAAFNKLSVKYTKQGKKLSLFKTATVVFGGSTIILICLLLLL